MATKEIKTRFALEGEQKYKNTMKDAANAIKVLNSQEKLAKAQFQQTGDAQKYAATQADLLKKKIEEQKTAVAAAEQAIKDLTANGVEPSSKQFQDWQLKMNNAQTALTKMETELQTLSGETNDANAQTAEFGETLSSLDKKANIDAVVKGIGKINDVLGAAVTKCKELAKELINSIKESAAWADDLATQAIIYGMDVETLQRMRYAAEIIDTDVETIVKARQKFENAMKSGKEEQFALFGVHTKRDGEFRDWEEVFWETGDALMHLTDGLTGSALDTKIIERDTAAMELFGKSWRELLPLFTAGREKYDEVMNSTSVVSEENVGKLTELDDAIKTTNQELTTLKTTVEAALAPALTEVANSLTEMFKKLNEYLATEEGQEKLKALEEATRELFSGLKDVDFGDALDKAKGALDKLKEGLNWIKDHKNQVIDAIKAIGLAFLGLKAIEGLGTIFQFINGAKGLVGGGGGGSNVSAPSGGPSPVDTAKTSPVGNAARVGGGSVLAGKFSQVLTSVSAADPTGSAALLLPVLEDQTVAGRILKNGGTIGDALASIPGTIQASFDQAVENWQKYPQQVQESVNNATEWLFEQILSGYEFKFNDKRDVEKEKKHLEQVAQENSESEFYDIFDSLSGYAVSVGGDEEAQKKIKSFADRYLQWLNDEITDPALDALSEKMTQEEWDAFNDTMSKIKYDDMLYANEDIENLQNSIKTALEAVESLMEEEKSKLKTSSNEAGTNSVIGLKEGIEKNMSVAVGAAQRLANAVRDTIKSALKIGSPSKVMEEFGGYITEGLANGITGGLGVVNSAAATMARAVSGGVDSASFAGGFSAMTQDGQMVNVTLMIDSERLTSVVVPLVNQSMGEEINLMRR